MEDLFTYMDHVFADKPLVALSAALVWGVLSLLLSPCHLTSIPLIIGFISGHSAYRRSLPWES